MKLFDALNESPARRAKSRTACVVVRLDGNGELYHGDVRLSDLTIRLCEDWEDWEPVVPPTKFAAPSPAPSSLNTLRDEVHALAEEKGWHERYASMTFGMNLTENENTDINKMHIATCLANIHGEVSEAMECLRDSDKLNWIQSLRATKVHDGATGKPEGFAIELADVLIRVLDLCGLLGIDIDEAVKRKHEYNKTRPYRHGGKAL